MQRDAGDQLSAYGCAESERFRAEGVLRGPVGGDSVCGGWESGELFGEWGAGAVGIPNASFGTGAFASLP